MFFCSFVVVVVVSFFGSPLPHKKNGPNCAKCLSPYFKTYKMALRAIHPDSVSSRSHSRLVTIGTPVPPFRLRPSVVSRALAPEEPCLHSGGFARVRCPRREKWHRRSCTGESTAGGMGLTCPLRDGCSRSSCPVEEQVPEPGSEKFCKTHTGGS